MGSFIASAAPPTWIEGSLVSLDVATKEVDLITGIKEGAKEVVVWSDEATPNSGSEIILQLGTTGGFVTSGYDYEYVQLNPNDSIDIHASSAGFELYTSGDNNFCSMIMRLALIDPSTNRWIANSGFCADGSGLLGGGVVSLPSYLDRVRIQSSGTNFRAGQAKVSYRL